MSSCSQSVRNHNPGGNPCIYTRALTLARTLRGGTYTWRWSHRTGCLSGAGILEDTRVCCPRPIWSCWRPKASEQPDSFPGQKVRGRGLGRQGQLTACPISPLATPRWGRGGKMERVLETDHSLTSRDHRKLHRWVRCCHHNKKYWESTGYPNLNGIRKRPEVDLNLCCTWAPTMWQTSFKQKKVCIAYLSAKLDLHRFCVHTIVNGYVFGS